MLTSETTDVSPGGSSSTTTDAHGYILYVDHQGHPAPLTECFHATASRRLSSSTYRYPLATIQDVDSAFCSQCMTLHDPTRAADLGYCPNASCRRCPRCLSIASVQYSTQTTTKPSSSSSAATTAGAECFYECGLCGWTSKECQLSVVIPFDASDDNSKLGRLELMRAAEDMSVSTSERRKVARKPMDDMHKQITDHWTNHAYNMRQNAMFPGGKKQQQQRQEKGKMEDEWSLEQLEVKLHESAAALQTSQPDFAFPSITGFEIQRIPIQDILSQTFPENEPTTSYPESMLAYSIQAVDGAAELPLPIPLTLRQSRRCRAELAEGRPGILLKPKLNPLEGDSSLPSGHGQWHRKDSSAIHVIPSLRVVRSHQFIMTDKGDGKKSARRVSLLKVSNPTLGTVRLRLSASTYKGEVDHWDDIGTASVTNSYISLLVDTISDTFVHAILKPDLTSMLQATETVELLSAEDSIIEMGGRARRTPEQVLNWNPVMIAESLDGNDPACIRLVARNASDAWFELVVRDDNHDLSSSTVATAVPISMQLDLGNGSWESSLIPAAEGVESDMVVFDLVLVWT